MAEFNILSVSQLNFYIKSILDGDRNLSNIFLTGEISNLTVHYKSGHIYLSLKDEKSAIKAIIFANSAMKLKFRPENGMKVIVRGRVSAYESSGTYQIYVDDMQPEGLGALNLAFEQLKDKLFKEGLFDESRKKFLPRYPKKVGVITSKTGAVFFDIKNVMERRYPLAEVVFYPVMVQGVEAPKQIADAINIFNSRNAADVIIVGRGGGSTEDLWAFNDEKLARTIAESKIPIISAVGHETDFTICDFVADKRAPTPSAAAELAVPDRKELLGCIEYNINYINSLIYTRLISYKERLANFTKSKNMRRPDIMIEERRIALDILSGKLKSLFLNEILKHESSFSNLAGKLDVLSPLKVLNAGYSLVTNSGGRTINSVKKAGIGDYLDIRMNDGIIKCVVKEIKKEKV